MLVGIYNMSAVVILESATVPCVCMVGFKASMGYSAVHMACVYKVLTVAAPVAGFCVCLVIEFNFTSCTSTLQAGWTALYSAAWKGRTAAVEVLVTARANVNIVNIVSLITSVVIVAHAFTVYFGCGCVTS